MCSGEERLPAARQVAAGRRWVHVRIGWKMGDGGTMDDVGSMLWGKVHGTEPEGLT